MKQTNFTIVNITFVKVSILTDLGDTLSKHFQYLDWCFGVCLFLHIFIYFFFFYLKRKQNYIKDKTKD